MALHYGWERFFSAIHGSIGSQESPQQRLAHSYCFDIIHVRREDVPSDETWQRIQELTQAVTRRPAKGTEGAVQATTSAMSADEAAKWLQEIVSIFGEIAEAYGAASNALVSEGVRRAVGDYREVIRKLANE